MNDELTALNYSIILCVYAPVVALADRQNVKASIALHLSGLVLTLSPPLTSPQMSSYIAPPYSSQLPLGAPSAGPHVTVSWLLAGHRAHQHLPGDPEVTRRVAVPGQAGPAVGVNVGGFYPKEKGCGRNRSSD